MMMTGLQYLMSALNAPEFEDSRDEFTERWVVIGGIMDRYAEQQVKNSSLATVSNTEGEYCPCGGKFISTNVTGDMRCEYCDNDR